MRFRRSYPQSPPPVDISASQDDDLNSGLTSSASKRSWKSQLGKLQCVVPGRTKSAVDHEALFASNLVNDYMEQQSVPEEKIEAKVSPQHLVDDYVVHEEKKEEVEDYDQPLVQPVVRAELLRKPVDLDDTLEDIDSDSDYSSEYFSDSESMSSGVLGGSSLDNSYRTMSTNAGEDDSIVLSLDEQLGLDREDESLGEYEDAPKQSFRGYPPQDQELPPPIGWQDDEDESVFVDDMSPVKDLIAHIQLADSDAEEDGSLYLDDDDSVDQPLEEHARAPSPGPSPIAAVPRQPQPLRSLETHMIPNSPDESPRSPPQSHRSVNSYHFLDPSIPTPAPRQEPEYTDEYDLNSIQEERAYLDPNVLGIAPRIEYTEEYDQRSFQKAQPHDDDETEDLSLLLDEALESHSEATDLDGDDDLRVPSPAELRPTDHSASQFNVVDRFLKMQEATFGAEDDSESPRYGTADPRDDFSTTDTECSYETFSFSQVETLLDPNEHDSDGEEPRSTSSATYKSYISDALMRHSPVRRDGPHKTGFGRSVPAATAKRAPAPQQGGTKPPRAILRDDPSVGSSSASSNSAVRSSFRQAARASRQRNTATHNQHMPVQSQSSLLQRQSMPRQAPQSRVETKRFLSLATAPTRSSAMAQDSAPRSHRGGPRGSASQSRESPILSAQTPPRASITSAQSETPKTRNGYRTPEPFHQENRDDSARSRDNFSARSPPEPRSSGSKIQNLISQFDKPGAVPRLPEPNLNRRVSPFKRPDIEHVSSTRVEIAEYQEEEPNEKEKSFFWKTHPDGNDLKAYEGYQAARQKRLASERTRVEDPKVTWVHKPTGRSSSTWVARSEV